MPSRHCKLILQVSVVPEGSDLLPGGYTVLMRLPRSYTHAAQSDFLVDLLVMHQPANDPLASARSGEPAHTSTACRHCHALAPKKCASLYILCLAQGDTRRVQVEGNVSHCLGSAWMQTALQSALAAAVPDMLSVQLRSVTAVSDHGSVSAASFAVATSHPPGTLPTQAC